MSPEDPRHGSPAGYQAHRKADEKACEPCRFAMNAYHKAREDNEPIGLEGGEWRLDPKTRVLRWVQVAPKPDPALDLIACPTCRAKVTETCRTRNGIRTSDHPTRLLKRRCECGGELRPKARWCLPCAAERKRAGRRESARRNSESEVAA